MKKKSFLCVLLLLASLSCNALIPQQIQKATLTPEETIASQPYIAAPTQTSTLPTAHSQGKTPPSRAAATRDPTKQIPATPTVLSPTFTQTASDTPPAPTATSPALLRPNLSGEAGANSIGDDYAPELGNTGYDVLNYTLQMVLDPQVVAIPSAAVIITAASTLESLGQFSLDFIGYQIDALTLDGKDAYYERTGNKLLVALSEPLRQDQVFTLVIRYHGEPVFQASPYVPFEDHVGLFFRTDLNLLYVVSEPDGARYWFPCNDHPRDKAGFRFELTVPEKLVGVANGVLVNTATAAPNAFPDGRTGDRYTWVEDHPMATYLATVAVGNYVRVEGISPQGIKLRSYVFPKQQAQMEALTPTIGQALDWMSDQFGAYPFDEFGYVTVSGLGGALETQGMVVLGTLSEEIMIHELAHMWFGDWVSLDSWGEMWRNEGFATYITTMWYARDNPGALDAQARSWSMAFQDGSIGPIQDPPPASLFGMGSYYGGALLVHELRAEMGEESFFAGLRDYLQRYRYAAASDEQFQEMMEAAAQKELDDFFSRWF